MTTMEEVICKAKELAETAGKKTGELVNLGKLKLEAAENERAISEKLEQIGSTVYEAHKNAASAEDALTPLFEEVDALKAKAAELNEKMDELRRTRHCDACGKNNPNDATFCQNCGKAL